MTYKEIISDIEKKLVSPVYFFCGEEPFYIDMLTNAIEKSVLDETEREFNQFVFYGRESNLATVLDAAYRFPMMANYQVIIVKEAQDLKDLLPRAKEKSKGKETKKSICLFPILKSPKRQPCLCFAISTKHLTCALRWLKSWVRAPFCLNRKSYTTTRFRHGLKVT